MNRLRTVATSSLARSSLAVVLATALTIAGCSSGEDGDTEGDSGSAADTTTIATNLEAPWSIAFHGETPLVSERDSGRILELSGGDPEDTREAREITTLDDVSPGGEGGLLGIAVHDNHLYTYFTAADDNRIERRELSGEPGNLELGDPETLLDGIPEASTHNGGRIAVGPDGMLYATVGDAGDREAAQDPGSLPGTILRMTPDGGIPDDNPSDDSPVYSYGHRNPQGIAWSDDGTMFASEFGQDTWDELNIIEPGNNYGWPVVEGIADDTGTDFTDPVQQWAPSDASPSGIAIADGTVHIANLRGERLIEVPVSDPGTSSERVVGEYGRLRDIVLTPDDELWLLTNNTDGRGSPGDDDDRILVLPR
ncbi:MAG: PQQ-dependent sugar dehydrogenase [Corynebacterium sp.]|uniref:PQQ-dependent sugar dehydrogenase n=1 Tax=Corynebacterium sp. TaxID=1720 RepID=UPI003F97DD1B